MSHRKNYVRNDDQGVLRVGGTDVMLDSLIVAYRNGDSPESIQQQFPSLTLEEVYGSIAYILANSEKIQEYSDSQDDVWKEWEAKAEKHSSQMLKRLRAVKNRGVAAEQ